MTSRQLIIPVSLKEGLLLTARELNQLGVAGLSYDLFDLLSHFKSLDKIPALANILPNKGITVLTVVSPKRLKVTEGQLTFSAFRDGERLTYSLTALAPLISQASILVADSLLSDKLSLSKAFVLSETPTDVGWQASDGNRYYSRETALLPGKSRARADFIESAVPLAMGLNGEFFQGSTVRSILDRAYQYELSPLDEHCSCYACKQFTLSYFHHLYQHTPLLASQLLARHNLTQYLSKT